MRAFFLSLIALAAITVVASDTDAAPDTAVGMAAGRVDRARTVPVEPTLATAAAAGTVDGVTAGRVLRVLPVRFHPQRAWQSSPEKLA